MDTDGPLCYGFDPELWFSFNKKDQAKAKKICARCSLRVSCAQVALDNPHFPGIWGATDEDERARLKRRAYRAKQRAALA